MEEESHDILMKRRLRRNAKIEVRPARPHEYGQAGQVTLSAWQPWTSEDDPAWKRFAEPIADVAARAKIAPVFVALVDGRIAGSVTLELNQRIPDDHHSAPLAPGEAHLRMLGVGPEFHRLGIAKALIRKCIIVAREQGKTRVTVNTSHENVVAQALYESLGFTRQRDVVRNGSSVCSFELAL
jgi:ribosomal protein S18 acetylase RimI-like enzyme